MVGGFPSPQVRPPPHSRCRSNFEFCRKCCDEVFCLVTQAAVNESGNILHILKFELASFPLSYTFALKICTEKKEKEECIKL